MRYPPVGHCIYCGTNRHSDRQQKLGDEHIIPEGLGGNLILPNASCGRCERAMNKFEQFCQRDMLGALRYQLRLPTKRPKNRPTKLPAARLRPDGSAEAIQIAIADYPVLLMLPIFPQPQILLPHPLRPSNLEALETFPKNHSLWNSPEKTLANTPKGLVMTMKGDQIRVPSGMVDTLKFGRMLAKIAHSYTVAELGSGAFHPILPPTLVGASEVPIHWLVGGMVKVRQPGDEQHIIRLDLENHHGRRFYVVRLRIFNDLGFPDYVIVSGVHLGDPHRLVRKMMQASPLTVLNFQRVTPLIGQTFRFPPPGLTDYICAGCDRVVCKGGDIPDGVTIRCLSCQTWNVPFLDGQRWRIPYVNLIESGADVPEPDETFARAVWVK